MHTSLPQDVLRLIIDVISNKRDLQAMRVVSQDWAAAVDNHTVTALCITRWNKRPFTAGGRRLQGVKVITVHTMPDWQHLEKLSSQLPHLHTLTIPDKVNSRVSAGCATALTSLTRLDLGTNGMQVRPTALSSRRGAGCSA